MIEDRVFDSLRAFAEELAEEVLGHGPHGIAPPRLGEVQITPVEAGSVVLAIPVALPSFDVRLEATIDEETPFEPGPLARAAARQLQELSGRSDEIQFMLTHSASLVGRALAEEAASLGLELRSTKLAPINLDLLRPVAVVEAVISGLGDDLRTGSHRVRIPALGAQSTLSSFLEQQRRRASCSLAIRKAGAAWLMDSVALRALQGSNVSVPAALHDLDRRGRTTLSGEVGPKRTWVADLFRRDGVVRVRGRVGDGDLWEGSRLTLDLQVGGGRALELIGTPLSSAFSHPWIEPSTPIVDADRSWGRWIRVEERLLLLDRDCAVIGDGPVDRQHQMTR